MYAWFAQERGSRTRTLAHCEMMCIEIGFVMGTGSGAGSGWQAEG